jgi:hypothetical protein
VAQLGARLDGIEEVVGSNPIGSTINPVDSIALPGCPYPKLALYHPGFGPILDLSRKSSFSRFRSLALALCATLCATPARAQTFRVPFHSVNGMTLLDGQKVSGAAPTAYQPTSPDSHRKGGPPVRAERIVIYLPAGV